MGGGAPESPGRSGAIPGRATPRTVDRGGGARWGAGATGGAAGLPPERPIIVPRSDAAGATAGGGAGSAGRGGGDTPDGGPNPMTVLLERASAGAGAGPCTGEGAGVGAAAPGPMSAPHCAQNRAPWGAGWPHCGQALSLMTESS